jgi:DNA-binding CsgD family transcriptional regulator
MIGFHPAVDRPVSRVVDPKRVIQEQIRHILSTLPRSVLNTPASADGPALVRHIAIGEERFRLVVELLPPNAHGDRLPIATVERVATEDLSETSLRERFRLTRKETHVALLLAQRRSNSEIADTLRISKHTARRHTENVMLKLNVTSRFSVKSALSAEA